VREPCSCRHRECQAGACERKGRDWQANIRPRAVLRDQADERRSWNLSGDQDGRACPSARRPRPTHRRPGTL